MNLTDLSALSYSGKHDGVSFECSPARYAEGKMALRIKRDSPDGMKGRAGRLLDVLNARWSRRSGYVLAPSRAAQWRALFVAGWDAGNDWRGCYGHKIAPQLESPTGEKMSLTEALRKISTP